MDAPDQSTAGDFLLNGQDGGGPITPRVSLVPS